jgi:glutamyl-tRNA reductase
MIELLGLNHKSAPIEVREKFVFCEEDVKRFVSILKEKGILGAVVLSTCNRTEIYVEFDNKGQSHPHGNLNGHNHTNVHPHSHPQDHTKGHDAVSPVFELFEETLFNYRKVDTDLRKHFYRKSHSEVVRHLFHVVSGLDSMALGEYQIVGQVKEAFNISEKNQLLSPVLNRLFNKAFEAGKKVRTNTCICKGAVSVSYAGVDLASKKLENIENQPVLLVGAGQTSELTLQNLVTKGCSKFTVVNRTFENAVEFASKYNAKAEEYSKLEELLLENNIVITSTASKKPLITREMVEKAMVLRNHNDLLFIDLSVPRNVAMDVVEIQNVHVFDIDDLHNVIEDSFEKRRGEICAAEEIIEELVVDFGNWVHSRNLIPTFQNICKYFHGISKSELEGYLKEQKTIDSPKASVYAEQITNKIIHNVINNVKALTDNGKNHEKIQLVNQLFSQN